MGTLELKNTALELLQKTEDSKLLKKIVDLLSSDNNEDSFDDLPAELQQILLNSEEDIKHNKFVLHQEVMNSFS